MPSKKQYPTSMLAVFLDKPGGLLVTKEVAVPIAGPGEVLVKIAAAPVNPSDLARLRNAHKEYDLSTFIPGLEGSGTVMVAGQGILPGLWLGKRVACSAEHNTSGSWAEYMVTSAAMCFPLSSKVSDDQGSMSLVNPLTALAFFDIVKNQRHKALINNAAASALGRMVELLGNKQNIPVINIVRNQTQVEKLKRLGSKYILDSSSPEFINDLETKSKTLNATVMFDSVCSSQLEKMIDVLPRDSEVYIYGNLSGEENIRVNPVSLIANNIHLSGFYLANQAKENGLFRNMINLRQVSRLMGNDLKIKIRGKYPLEKAQEAVDIYLSNMSEGKVLLVPAGYNSAR